MHDLQKARHPVPARRQGRAGRARRLGLGGQPPQRRPRRCAPRRCSMPPDASARPPGSTSRPAASRPTTAAGSRSIRKTFQTSGAAHLCRRRRDRLSEPCLDRDGAGTHRRLPRVRRADAPGARVLSLRHLRGAGDFDSRPDRGAGAGEGDPLRGRHRAVPRDLARAHHGARGRHDEDAVLARGPQAARRPHPRRGRDRADPHRPGGAQPRRHDRLFRRERLQLSDAGRRPTRSRRSMRSTGWARGARACVRCRRSGRGSRRTRWRRRGMR